ncbi:MAG TPA: RNA methyltransferase [Drouetiella sp.]|jgi:RNA methyltransferase, TrmH family
MKINSISSASNSLLKKVRSLQQRSGREEHGLFLLEGPKLLAEAQAKGISIQDVIVSASYLNAGFSANDSANIEQLTVVEDKLFRDLITTSTPCGIVSVGRIATHTFADCLQGTKTLIAVAESVQDPGNLGTMIRAALAFGATGLVATAGSVDAFNPKVVRSAMGALFKLPVIVGMKMDEVVKRLKEEKIKVVALEPAAEKPFWQLDLTDGLAFLFGNEGNGLSSQAAQLADEIVTIPMAGDTESLNVAVSSAVVLFECARQRSAVKR